jgi:dTDP-4-dehydrorhamnose reductase
VARGELLVLGASGFLGPHVVAAAKEAGWRVIAASRSPGAAPSIDGRAADELATWDAERAGETEELIERARPAAILLAAALARADACEREPARARALNASLPHEVARLARERGIRLVHVSTDLVFGGRPAAGARYSESDAPSPVHAYGRSKAEGEAAVLAECPAALVVRVPLLYGDSVGRGLGASDQLLAALRRGERPVLFTDEWRTPLEVGNAARALVECATRSENGLLHVAGPERLTRFELGLAVLEARGLQSAEAAERVRGATRAELGLAEGRARDASLDSSRARALLATPLHAPRAALARLAP